MPEVSGQGKCQQKQRANSFLAWYTSFGNGGHSKMRGSFSVVLLYAYCTTKVIIYTAKQITSWFHACRSLRPQNLINNRIRKECGGYWSSPNGCTGIIILIPHELLCPKAPREQAFLVTLPNKKLVEFPYNLTFGSQR